MTARLRCFLRTISPSSTTPTSLRKTPCPSTRDARCHGFLRRSTST
jgi:hypothetical protein